jgi:hypothetical protein
MHTATSVAGVKMGEGLVTTEKLEGYLGHFLSVARNDCNVIVEIPRVLAMLNVHPPGMHTLGFDSVMDRVEKTVLRTIGGVDRNPAFYVIFPV